MIARLLKVGVVSALLVVWTWLCFLPIAGFHHMFRCGLLGWAILDGENGPLEVRWSLVALLASVVLWCVPVTFFSWLALTPRARSSS